MSVGSGTVAAGVAEETGLVIRSLVAADREQVVAIDAWHTGTAKPDYWARVFAAFLAPPDAGLRVGLAAVDEGRLVGYLLGEVRAFEFGSEPCGWVFAVGVAEPYLRRGVARRLLGAAIRRFRGAGLDLVRTMVRRNDVPVLSFFRAAGFAGGPYVELELPLTGGSDLEEDVDA